MLNIGVRPTIDGSEKTIEVHVINFDEDIYGERLVIFFDDWIRKEQKFESLDALKSQLVKDRTALLNRQSSKDR